MRLLVRGNPGKLRSAMSFTVSASVHGWILAWVALSPVPRAEKTASVYDQLIRPHEEKIVWYHSSDRLPDISPSRKRRESRPPEARARFEQSLVAGSRQDRRPPQLIYMPEPEVELPKPLPLPNVVAVVPPPPRPVRAFTPPVARPPPAVPAILPEAPRIVQKTEPAILPVATAAPRPPPRAFTAPALPPPAPAVPAILPEAPRIVQKTEPAILPVATAAPRPQPRAFTAPALPPPARKEPALLEAPAVANAIETGRLRLDLPDPRAPLRSFTPPPSGRPAAATNPDLPAAPAADVPAAPTPSEATLVIAGIHPVKAPDFPTPPGGHQAGFSAGPQPRTDARDGASNDNAMIVAPDLAARGGAKEERPTLVASVLPSRQSLVDAARAALRSAPAAPADSRATRVSGAPDPRLEGRAVYSLAIQMPNVTSYTGSWIVWFSEREALPGAPAVDVRAPVPLRKVDPKYIAAAADERVEGTVRLFAVIRKTGRVDSVALLRHLDDRLDRSAEEALEKWEFEPALRNGAPVDVDAVFEIPFRLAPRPAK